MTEKNKNCKIHGTLTVGYHRLTAPIDYCESSLQRIFSNIKSSAPCAIGRRAVSTYVHHICFWRRDYPSPNVGMREGYMLTAAFLLSLQIWSQISASTDPDTELSCSASKASKAYRQNVLFGMAPSRVRCIPTCRLHSY